MAGPNLFQQAGSRGNKETRFAPIFTNRFFTGLWTQRNPLRDPSQVIYERWYGGRPDALWSGYNVELTNNLTLARRPGTTSYVNLGGNPVTLSNIQAPVDNFYSFHQFTSNTESIKLLADTAGNIFNFTTSAITSIFSKTGGAGQTSFQSVGNYLYFGDGKDQKFWDGTTVNNWGIATPSVAPTVTPNALFPQWASQTFYSNSGVIIDANGNVQFILSGGTSGYGQPVWNTTVPGTSTTTDNTVTWTYQAAVFYPTWPAKTAVSVTEYFFDQTTGTLWECTTAGVTASTRPAFPTTGTVTSTTMADGTVTWTLQAYPSQYAASSITWQPGTNYVTGNVVLEPSIPIATTTVTLIPGTGIPGTPGTGFNGIPPQYSYNTTWSPAYVFLCTGGGTSSSLTGQPTWASSVGSKSSDGPTIKWQCIELAASLVWANGHAYTGAPSTATVTNTTLTSHTATYACANTFTAGQVVTIQGTSNGSGVFNVSYATILTADSGHFTITISSADVGQAIDQGIAYAYGNCFIKDNLGNLWMLTQNGTSGGSTPAWTYFSVSNVNSGTNTIIDGGCVWTNVGPIIKWQKGVIYASFVWGGSFIIDGNGYVQQVAQSGTTGTTGPKAGTPPSGTTGYWGRGSGALTTDGTVQWLWDSIFANSPTYPVPGSTGIPYLYAYCFVNSTTGHYSTASPLTAVTVSTPGDAPYSFTITGGTISDSQVDKIAIFRSVTGGSSPDLFLVATIPYVSGWQYVDTTPDSEIGPNLVISVPSYLGTTDHANDPPPSGLVALTYHMGRVWGAVNNTVYYASGPDCNTGNGAQAWPPANYFTFPSTVIRMVPTSSGLFVFTISDIYIILGNGSANAGLSGTGITVFYATPFIQGIGLLSPNALDINGTTIYMFTADGQMLSFDPSSGISEIGFPIGDKLSAYNPANVYVTWHVSGSQDKAVYVSDGSGNGYRCNTSQAPDGGFVWSPQFTITGGAQAIQSIEVTPGVKRLLIGPGPLGGPILYRNTSVFTDAGSAYASWFVMGSIILAQPGQMAELSFITMDFMPVGTQPTVSVLLDEISATNGASFEKISGYVVGDPPKLLGPTAQPATLFSDRFYFSQSVSGGDPIPAWCRHLQCKVDFGATDTAQNELLTFTIFGAHWAEK